MNGHIPYPVWRYERTGLRTTEHIVYRCFVCSLRLDFRYGPYGHGRWLHRTDEAA